MPRGVGVTGSNLHICTSDPELWFVSWLFRENPHVQASPSDRLLLGLPEATTGKLPSKWRFNARLPACS